MDTEVGCGLEGQRWREQGLETKTERKRLENVCATKAQEEKGVGLQSRNRIGGLGAIRCDICKGGMQGAAVDMNWML